MRSDDIPKFDFPKDKKGFDGLADKLNKLDQEDPSTIRFETSQIINMVVRSDISSYLVSNRDMQYLEIEKRGDNYYWLINRDPNSTYRLPTERNGIHIRTQGDWEYGQFKESKGNLQEGVAINLTNFGEGARLHIFYN